MYHPGLLILVQTKRTMYIDLAGNPLSHGLKFKPIVIAVQKKSDTGPWRREAFLHRLGIASVLAVSLLRIVLQHFSLLTQQDYCLISVYYMRIHLLSLGRHPIQQAHK